jgi:lactate dehydrogenase-like 2-hydroxyacid dehydrogenase
MMSSELVKFCKDADAVLCMFYDKFDAEIMDQCPKIKIISTYSVGYNNIDVHSAKERGIYVTNTPDVLTNATADLAMGLLLSVSRNIVKGDNTIRNGEFKSWTPTWFLGLDLFNKTVGIVGLGRIGQNFAKKARAFNMNIIYHSSKKNHDFDNEFGAKLVSMETLIKESDFISLHVPLTDKTRYMFGKKEFDMMKNSAVIINTSRGAVIDEDALANALMDNLIYGAGLDVFEDEPNVNPKLISLDNVVLTPHIGSSTYETRIRMAEISAQSIYNALLGQKIDYNVYQL